MHRSPAKRDRPKPDAKCVEFLIGTPSNEDQHCVSRPQTPAPVEPGRTVSSYLCSVQGSGMMGADANDEVDYLVGVGPELRQRLLHTFSRGKW